MYSILPYTKAKAKELGVEIKPSKKKNKKIDIIYQKNESNEQKNVHIGIMAGEPDIHGL